MREPTEFIHMYYMYYICTYHTTYVVGSLHGANRQCNCSSVGNLEVHRDSFDIITESRHKNGEKINKNQLVLN